MSTETPAQRRRRLQANWTEEDVYQDESDRLRRSVWMLKAVQEIERLKTLPPGTVAYLAARAAVRETSRRLVHQHQDDGLSIAQTAARTGLDRRYVSELRAEPRD